VPRCLSSVFYNCRLSQKFLSLKLEEGRCSPNFLTACVTTRHPIRCGPLVFFFRSSQPSLGSYRKQFVAFPTACSFCITAHIIYFIQSFLSRSSYFPSSCSSSAFLYVVIDQQDGSGGVRTPQPPCSTSVTSRFFIFFTFMWPCIVTDFFIIKSNRCINFPTLLRHETLHLSGSSSAHHQEFVHCTLGIGICHTGMKRAFEQDKDVPSWSCSKALFEPVWHIPVPSVQWTNSWWWAEELPETCRISCWSKVGKLVHLVSFIIKKSRLFLGLFFLF